MCIRTHCMCSWTVFWGQVITILWTTEMSCRLEFISWFIYSCFSDDKNRLLCQCYRCLFWLKQDVQQDPVLIHMIQNKGSVKQSFLSSKVLGKGRGKGTSKKQTINSHLGLFRAFPRVCKLHWVRTQHCSFLSTSVSCIHSSRRKVLAMIKPLPQVKPAVDPCLFLWQAQNSTA